MGYIKQLNRHFHCEIGKLFKKFCNILQIFKIAVFLFDLFTNKARNPEVEESNQSKAILTKLWLATDGANCLPAI